MPRLISCRSAFPHPTRCVIDGRNAIVERLDLVASEPQVLDQPLVAVQADPDAKRSIGAELDEGRPELAIDHIDVDVLDEGGVASGAEPASDPFVLGRRPKAVRLLL